MKKYFLFVIDLVIALYSILSALVIVSMPINKFEWMLEDPLLADEKLTFCTLPVDDGGTPFISILYILPLLVAGLIIFAKKRQIHPTLWIAFGLSIIWFLRFVLLYPSCP
ncbi:hypothetical protein TKWG_13135 [Advenella kashmirensis WT001]|uniref:DUF2645 domain-containing protein n=1 Tax=Advenella kashmirensis (strain DSM 17095 / LMG 22695 / WT001) TaxID=1036672 RepID=I3UCL5_ADVKW|nr:hypothetical protein [Advenella kashmirensis]AFK62753.1 hypothetical protein TKWG_13135 [Advenella kashmirensis WT001]